MEIKWVRGLIRGGLRGRGRQSQVGLDRGAEVEAVGLGHEGRGEVGAVQERGVVGQLGLASRVLSGPGSKEEVAGQVWGLGVGWQPQQAPQPLAGSTR